MQWSKIRSRLLDFLEPELRIALCLALACSLLSRSAHGQATQKTLGELDSAVANVKSGNVSPRDVVVIANAGAVQAIPALEEQFKRATDVDTKVSIASGLVKLGDRDNTYWNFLLEQATLAVDSDLPDPFRDSKGNLIGNKQLSPEFKAWIQAHNVDASTAVWSAIYGLPGKVLPLATTRGPARNSASTASAPVPQLPDCRFGCKGVGSDSRQAVNTADHCGNPEGSTRI